MPRKQLPARRKPAVDLTDVLAPLYELAFNLRWSWDAGARALFEAIDPPLWDAVEHNPVALLGRLPKAQQARLAADRSFVAELRRTHHRLGADQRARTWFQKHYGGRARGCVAYFSMEFGLHESLPVFAGGLGVLAGDHFKSVSDLGLPLVGVGIFWRHGYTRQSIEADNRQTDRHDRLSPDNLPLAEVTGPNGRPLRIRFPVASDTVVARAWCLEVGRTPIYLLDTNLPGNAPKHRKLTDRLYSGDRDTRIRQEILLGIGGWRLLRALELPVAACHLNEGHAAFCSLERVADIIRGTGCDFDGAARRVAAATVFTAHTPIPAGNETFAPKLVTRYLGSDCRRFGLTSDRLLALGRVDPGDEGEDFGMTPLALRLADRANGVSELHGQVSRRMWHALWPRRAVDRVPIGHITNGIHLRTWLHPAMAELLDEFLPTDWDQHQDRPSVWSAAMKIPDARLWNLHRQLKAELIYFVLARLQGQLRRYSASDRKIAAPGANLDAETLTIGFARRFATYKRATLIFSDLRRIERIVNHAKRPVQLIFAGKAHPADEEGKALVAEVVGQSRSRRFHGRVVFIEDYGMEIARHLVAGVDVWLNTPRKPREASGTSGMKPALHGGLNLGILDGWWPEGIEEGLNGWAIGTGRDHDGSPQADRRDARALYQRLEREVVPLYYDRPRANRPTKWIRCMKRAIATIPVAFNSHRMVKEYLKRYYLPMLTAKRR